MGLGWLRLALSLLVIDAHYGGFRELVQPRLVGAFGIDRLAFIGEGAVAIAGFFVISGYVITYVLARKYDAASWRGIGVFYAGRALRIYPLYLLVFGAYWLALAAMGAAPALAGAPLAHNLLLLPLGVAALFGDEALGAAQLTGFLLIGPAWTLCFDLLLYVLAPFFVLRRRVLGAVWLVGLAWFVAFIVVLDGRPPVWFAHLYTSPLAYVFAFASGALVYHYGHVVAGRSALLVAAGTGLVWVTFLPFGPQSAAAFQLAAILLLAIVVAILKDLGAGQRADRLFGDLTYATYLLHLPLLLLLERAGVAGAPWWGLALTYAIALALLFAFEYPLDRFRERLHRRLSGIPFAPSRGIGCASIATLVVIAVAAAASFVRGGLHGGGGVRPVIAACPAGWRCTSESGRLAVLVNGAGELTANPALPTDQRVLADIALDAGAGEVFAGFRMAGLDVGLRRTAGACVLVVRRDGTEAPSPARWNGDCTRLHRFVLDGSTGTMTVAVDSLWVYPTTARSDAAHVVVEALPAAHANVRLEGLFTTSRQRPDRGR